MELHHNLIFRGQRLRGLLPAVNNDEPLRKGEQGSGGGGTGSVNSVNGISPDVNGNVSIVLFSGAWDDLTGKPLFSSVAFNGNYSSLNGLPALFSGNYADLTNRPTLFSGNYNDLANKPANIPRRVQVVSNATGAINCNFSLYDEIRLTLTGNVSLTFSGATDGQGCILRLKQDASGGRQISLPPSVRYSTDLPDYIPTATAGRADRIGFIYDTADTKYDFVSVVKGFL